MTKEQKKTLFFYFGKLTSYLYLIHFHKKLKKVGCVGRISSFNEAEDNRYLITLSGIIRFEVQEELDVTTPYRQILADYDNYKSDTENQNINGIDRSKLLALVKRYLEHRKILADWEIIKQTIGNAG